MSVSAYVGLFGHGKSYSVVENVILPAIKTGRTVYTNIPMQLHVWVEQFGVAPVYFDIEDVKNNDNWFTEVFEPGAVFVLDESWQLWPAGETLKNAKPQHKQFVQEHRHLVSESGLSTDIVIIASDLTIIASWLRSGIETTYKTNKLTAIGVNNGYRMDIYSGAVVGHSPPKSRLIRQLTGTYKDEVTRLYKSQTKSKAQGHVKELRVDGRANLLKSWGFWFRFALPLVAFPLAFIYLTSLFGSDDKSELETTEEKVGVIGGIEESHNGKLKINVPVRLAYLSKADLVYITSNRGWYPDIKFLFRIEVGDRYNVLGKKELASLGYKIKALNECLVEIRGHDFNDFVYCRSPELIDEEQSPVDPFDGQIAGQ